MKKIGILILSVLLVTVVALSATVGIAYFSHKEIYNGILGTEVELLFDKLNADALARYQETELPEGTVIDEEPRWGSIQNPYIISDIKHLYNLSELQRLNYFYNNFISDNYTDGAYNRGKSMPYFRVCTPDGTPVTIDGNTFGRNITAIGTAERPFIGSLKGAFTDGTCTVDGKSSDTSVIYDVTVLGDPANVDAGLFAYVRQLGEPGAEGTEFDGQISELSNIVLYDVTVDVRSSLWDTVTAFITDHIFAFNALPEEEQDKVPHENHHIGILAGHLSYTKAEYISVYYSNNDTVAIDLRDATVVDGVKANYLSVSGILGYIDCMNPTVTEDGRIVAGSGKSNDGLSTGGDYIGGGGALSGDKPGYVLAKDIYNNYGYSLTEAERAEGKDLLIKDAMDSKGEPLCQEWVRDRLLWLGTENTGRYYFYDGVFTFALTGTGDAEQKSKDVITDTWASWEDRTFRIGPSDTDRWVTNYSQGNNSVAAFLRPLTSDNDLAEALNRGKRIFITYDRGNDFLLMNLSKPTNTDVDSTDVTGEQKYTTDGIIQYFGNENFKDSIIESFNGKQVPLDPTMIDTFAPKDASGDPITTDMDAVYNNIVGALSGTDGFYQDEHALKLINVGITSNSVSLEQLRNMYGISANIVADTYAYYDYETHTISVSPNANGQIEDYYDYATSGYDGYFYYTGEWGGWYTYWSVKCYWQPTDGSPAPSDPIFTNNNYSSDPKGNMDKYFDELVGEWNGEKVYSFTVGDKTYTGVAIDWDTKEFAGSGNAAQANGATLTKSAGSDLYCYYARIEDIANGVEKFYSCANGQEVTLTIKEGDISASGAQIYTVGNSNNRCIKIIRHPCYQFAHEANNNIMRLLYLNYGFVEVGNYKTIYYPLWNGTDSVADVPANFAEEYNNLYFDGSRTPEMDYQKNAVLKFNDDGTCYVSYTLGDMTRYISYGSNGTVPAFVTEEHFNDSCKLRIYSLEGTQSLNYGRVTFDPKDKTDENTFSTDTHIFFANSERTNASKKDEYSIVKITDLGWSNGDSADNGGILHGGNLDKRFRMAKGLAFGETYTMLGGSLPSEGIVQAPVGTLGIKANIPQGSIAFRINDGGKEMRIRVIVAMPATIYSKGEDGYNEAKMNDNLHYFNLWQMQEVGSDTVETFDAADAMDRFILPSSYGYTPGTEPKDGQYVSVNKGSASKAEDGSTSVTPGTDSYSCSLNGDRILVGYEFTVSEVGLYVLGASSYSEELSKYVSTPMEIVYFSADGVASTGRGGDSGSQLGTVDFIYDYSNKLITVTQSSSTDADGKEDYNGYYPSYTIMYFDNTLTDGAGFVAINDERIRVRRWINTESTADIKSTIDITIGSYTPAATANKYAKASYYAKLSDIINEKYEDLTE